MKYIIKINDKVKFEINTKNPHGPIREYLINCQLAGEKVEIVKKL